jgi:hypothetical protein
MWEQTLYFLVWVGAGLLWLALFGVVAFAIEMAERPERTVEWWKSLWRRP